MIFIAKVKFGNARAAGKRNPDLSIPKYEKQKVMSPNSYYKVLSQFSDFDRVYSFNIFGIIQQSYSFGI